MGSCASKESPQNQSGSAPLQSRAGQQAAVNSGAKRATLSGQVGPKNGRNNSSAGGGLSEASNEYKDEKNGIEHAMPQTLDKELKILLLGSGESGKSTIVKQMKILHKNGFTDAEAYEYKPFVYKNVLDCVKNIINAIIDLNSDLIAPQGSEVVLAGEERPKRHVLSYDDLNDILDYEVSVDTEEQFDLAIAQKIKLLYTLPEVLDFTKKHQADFYLIDSTDYFLSNIDRIAQPGYIPTQADILRTRKKTSGIFDFRFPMGGLNIHMFDVGGQRSERKKWIHCFDNVTLIIFCVALSEYDQVLLEENTQNRLEESLALFDSVVNSRWFSRTSVVLFLNKIDVFAQKLPYLPLEKHFPDYNGGDNINKAVKYILWRFTQVNRSGLNVYPHVTQATDTSNIQLVFAAVKETILENLLKDSGIL